MEARTKWSDERLDDRFDSVDKRFDRLEGHMDARFDRIDRRLDWLTGAVITIAIALIGKGVLGG